MRKPKAIDRLLNYLGYVKAAPAVTAGSSYDIPYFPHKKTADYLAAFRGWVYACASARSEDLSTIRLRLFKTTNAKTGETEEVTDHEVLSLLRRVNPFTTQRELFEATQAYKDLAGEAFWYLVPGTKLKVEQIWLLRPDWINVIPDQTTFLKHYEYRVPGNEKIIIKPENLIHHKYFNPLDPYRGLSIVGAAALAVDAEVNAEQYNNKFFENSAIPSVVMQTEQKLDETMRKRMREAWNNEYGGKDKAHRMVIMEGGLEVKPFTFAPKDMEFLAGLGFNRDKIMSIFRVPKTRLGITEDVNLANAEETMKMYMRFVVRPLMERIRDTLNEFLLPRYDEDLFFAFDDPVPENEEANNSKYKTLVALGAMTPNEVRQEEGMDAVDGLDNFYIPANLVPITSEVDDADGGGEKKITAPRRKERIIMPPTLATRVRKEIAQKVTDEVVKSIAETFRKSSLEKNTEEIGRTHLTDAQQETMWKATTAKAERFEDRYRSELKSIFARQEKETLDRLEKTQKALSPSDLDKILFVIPEENKAAAAILIPILKEYLDESGNDTLDSLGLSDQVFDTTVATVKEFFAITALKGIKQMNKLTKAKLKEVLALAVKEGQSIPQVTKAIKDVFAAADTVRATKIARTEILRAGNRGTIEAFKQSGVVAGKQWFTALDERVCQWCAPMHGNVISLNDNYFDKGSSFLGKEGGVLNLDYVDVDAPPLHPNCRCVPIPITITRGRSMHQFPKTGDGIEFKTEGETESEVNKRIESEVNKRVGEAVKQIEQEIDG